MTDNEARSQTSRHAGYGVFGEGDQSAYRSGDIVSAIVHRWAQQGMLTDPGDNGGTVHARAARAADEAAAVAVSVMEDIRRMQAEHDQRNLRAATDPVGKAKAVIRSYLLGDGDYDAAAAVQAEADAADAARELADAGLLTSGSALTGMTTALGQIEQAQRDNQAALDVAAADVDDLRAELAKVRAERDELQARLDAVQRVAWVIEDLGRGVREPLTPHARMVARANINVAQLVCKALSGDVPPVADGGDVMPAAMAADREFHRQWPNAELHETDWRTIAKAALTAEREQRRTRIDAARQIAFEALRGIRGDSTEVIARMILAVLDGEEPQGGAQ